MSGRLLGRLAGSGLSCFGRSLFWLHCVWIGCLFLGCQSSPSPSTSSYPPTASDLNLLSPLHLCQKKSIVEQAWQRPFIRSHWGSGEQWTFDLGPGAQPRYRWLFFSEDDILVGAVFAFPQGLHLTAYPLLRQTLAQLTPAREFFLNPRSLLHGDRPSTGLLYRTGDKTTTTQYVVLHKEPADLSLLVAAFTLDPYEYLLEGTNPEFLRFIAIASSTPPSQTPGNAKQTRDDAFLAAQQFARGEAALFGSCGVVKNDVAITAYRQAIELGIKEPLRLAQAHYRLALALRNVGRYTDALTELDQAITIRPNTPAFHNTAGTLRMQLGEIPQAIAEYELALALKPNYARARFNLAEALESIDPRRAIEEYETYLSLVEDVEAERSRALLAQERLRRLKR